MNKRIVSATPIDLEEPPTAPPVARSSMRAIPWFGVLRGLLLAVASTLPTSAPPSAAPWQAAGRRRRGLLLAIVTALAVAAVALQVDAAQGEASALWAAHAALAALLFAWVGSGFVTALMGMWVMLRGDAQGLALRGPRAPIDGAARTALIMPICNEDIATVFGGLHATCASLAATGALRLFDIYLLSDSTDPALRAAELDAWNRLRAELGDAPVRGGGRVFYRWRRRRTGRKAGNVADFCRRWGRNYRYMVVLDADSTMSGDTLVDLVRLMEQHPRAGIVQTLPQARGQMTVHARLQQFANRVTGRLFALGMSYWQLGESHYWGHNAILRVEPFMRHCALAPIPGRGGLSGSILSHDFVEAAMMRRAGYEVWLAPQLEGSWEQYPPNLLAELQRDRRWCQGNLQNARLIAEPGWRPVHRAMFLVGALSYVTAPLWIAFVALGLLAGDATPGGSWLLWGLTLLLLLSPRLLGVLSVRLTRDQVRYGGMLRLVASALLELSLSAVQAPLRMLAHTGFVIGSLTGLRLEWNSPPRDADALRWRDAATRLGFVSLLALSTLLLLVVRDGAALAPSYPLLVLLPLLLAVPFAVLTGDPRIGVALRRLGLLGDDDARVRVPPRSAAIAATRHDEARALPSAYVSRARPAALFGVRRAAIASVAAAALAVAAVVPEVAHAPRAHSLEVKATLSRAPAIDRAHATVVAVSTMTARSALRPRMVPDRPARMIDDDVRRRALEAVQRALEQGDASPV